MRFPVRRCLTLAAVLALLSAPAPAGDEGDKPAKPADQPAAPAKVEAEKGPYIAWAKSHADAAQEASERNLCIYLHSHGST